MHRKEQLPNTAQRSKDGNPAGRSSLKSRGAPYLPSNPSRRKPIAVKTHTSIADPYSSNKQRVPPAKTKSQKLLNRARSVPPRSSNAAANRASLDDIAPSSGSSSRPSRWESSSAEASAKSTGMAMPPRRRALSPSPDNDTPPTRIIMSKRSSIATSTPSQELKQLRRKFSGTETISNPPHSSNSNGQTTPTALQSAMQARRIRLMKPRRESAPKIASSPSSSLSRLAPIDIQSDDDDDHVYVRRTNSNKGIFFPRDDSPARTRAQPNHKSSREHSRRRSDVGPVRIPAAFAADDMKSKKEVEDDPTRLLGKLELSNNNDDDDELVLGGDLDGLVKALDKQSEDHVGHIFCSSSQSLFAFADDESDDED